MEVRKFLDRVRTPFFVLVLAAGAAACAGSHDDGEDEPSDDAPVHMSIETNADIPPDTHACGQENMSSDVSHVRGRSEPLGAAATLIIIDTIQTATGGVIDGTVIDWQGAELSATARIFRGRATTGIDVTYPAPDGLTNGRVFGVRDEDEDRVCEIMDTELPPEVSAELDDAFNGSITHPVSN